MVSFQTALVTWSHLTSLSIVNLSRLINFLLNFFSGEKNEISILVGENIMEEIV